MKAVPLRGGSIVVDHVKPQSNVSNIQMSSRALEPEALAMIGGALGRAASQIGVSMAQMGRAVNNMAVSAAQARMSMEVFEANQRRRVAEAMRVPDRLLGEPPLTQAQLYALTYPVSPPETVRHTSGATEFSSTVEKPMQPGAPSPRRRPLNLENE